MLAEPKTKLLTGRQFAKAGYATRCELVAGEVVEMSPVNIDHGFLEVEIGAELRNFVRQKGIGWVFGGETGIYTQREPDTIRGVDVGFISKERLPKRPKKGFLAVAPELVVEIVSPHDRWNDINDKIEEYFAIGVLWVWIVEPKNKTVRVYRSVTEIQKLGEVDTLLGEGLLAGFAFPLAELFAES